MQARNAIVTGASHGIGPYIARALAARGMNLLLVARSEDELDRVAEELRSLGTRVAVAAIDLGDPDAARRVADAAAATLGPVDVLVNNAAVELQRRFHTLDTDDIENVLRVDLLTPIELTHLVLSQMLERGYGRIVNVSSIAGRVGFPNAEAYAAAKDGLIAFSRVLRNDYRSAGVSASAVILGAVKNAGLGQRTIEELGVQTSTSFMVAPETVARAVVRAIEKDKAELVVMPGPGRVLKALLDLFPGLGATMNRISGAERYMSLVADYREQNAARPGEEAGPPKDLGRSGELPALRECGL
jgi:short-subunit dehydrogenase